MIILYPTDTVYGLGTDATNKTEILRLLELKGRSDTKMLIAVDGISMMEEYAEVTPLARKLARQFLPGKLSLVLKAKNLPEELLLHMGTIGVRIPDHPASMRLVKELGGPIVSTSANITGEKPERSVPKILKQFGDKASMIDMVIDGGELPESEPSTVVDVRGDTPIIIREGAISKKQILNATKR